MAGSGRVSRFRSNYFQQRIRSARNFKRNPKILPEARTNVSLSSFTRRSQILWGIFIVFFLSFFSYVIFSGKFTIKNVSVSGVNTIPEETVIEWLQDLSGTRTYFIFPGDHYFAVTKERVEKLLSSKTVYFKTVEDLNKKLPDSLDLVLAERTPLIVWKSGENSFLLDDEGFVLEKVPENFASATTTRETYLVVEEGTPGDIAAGNFYGREKIEFLSDVAHRWNNRLEYRINFVQIPKLSSSDVYVTTDLGFTAYLSSTGDISHQMETLTRILRQIIASDKIIDLAYIDVRLPVIAYYCFRGEPCGSLETDLENETENEE